MRISDWSSDVCSSELVPYQTFSETGGRAFMHFTREGEHWLAFTGIVNASTLCRWNGELFVAHQQLGAGGEREFQIIEQANALFLVRVRFIAGTPASRSEEPRVGKECVSTYRYRGSPYH